jgi:hypothetical protein
MTILVNIKNEIRFNFRPLRENLFIFLVLIFGLRTNELGSSSSGNTFATWMAARRIASLR